ncbi:retrotransposon line subclass [Hordeum vulgare]|nr:retrotransposon line subclass [Hordeum vulgare]
MLTGFGDVRGFCTIFHKSFVVPIWSTHIDFDHILSGVLLFRASIPVKYLGLPLLVWNLKKVDIQYLEDKAADKLVTWDGRNITIIGCTTLVKSVIITPAVYDITSLIMSLSSLHNINKLERAFLCSGWDKTTGAKCIIN